MTAIEYETVDEVPDDLKPIDDEPEYACQVCGIALEYAGRGRKPKYCAEHKPGASTKSRTPARANDTAALAASVLAQMNGYLGLGLMIFGLPLTATEINKANEQFRELAYEALLLDSKLSKRIVSAGGKSAGVALSMAYATLTVNVAPVAMQELKQRKASKNVDTDPSLF